MILRMNKSMNHASRARITLSLPATLVRLIDARSVREGLTRSGLVERLLTERQRENAKQELEANVVAYYSSEPTEDDLALSSELARAARAVLGDERPKTKRRGKRQ